MPQGLRPATIAALFVGWAVALGGFVWWAAHRQADPLCAGIDDALGAQCRRDFPAPEAFSPGALVDAQGNLVGSLNGPACLLPGAPPIALPVDRGAGQAAPTQLPRVTYTSLQGGGLTSIPAPPGLMSGDAAWSSVHEAGIEIGGVERAQLRSAGAVNACMLQQVCAQHIADGSWRVVDATYAAEVRYRFIDAHGRAIAPSSGALQRRGDWQRLLGRRVVALTTLGDDAAAAIAGCASDVARIQSGSASASIRSHGMRGAFAAQTSTRPLGQIALAAARGKEYSDCSADVGREKSHAYAQAHVDSMADGGLRMAGEVRASSGRYRYGRCVPGRVRLPSNNLVVNPVTARIALDGELDVALRNPGPHRLAVNWHGAPPTLRLRVLAPDGRVLHDGLTAQPQDALAFDVTGPGIFRILPSVALTIERRGESGVKSESFHARIGADATPPGAAPAPAESAADAAETPAEGSEANTGGESPDADGE